MQEQETNEHNCREYFEVKKFKKYLTFIAEHLDYSQRNVCLILDQKPDARIVLSLDEWIKQGNSVRKKSRPIEIFVSRRVVRRDEDEVYLRTEEGEKIIEIREILNPCLFDVSDTVYQERYPVPLFNCVEFLKPLERYAKIFVGLHELTHRKIVFESLRVRQKIQTPALQHSILLSPYQGEEETLKSLLREILEEGRLEEEVFSDFETRAVAYSVFKHLHLSCEKELFPELKSWQDEQMMSRTFQALLQRITTRTQTFIKALDSTLTQTFDVSAGKNPFERRLIAAQKWRGRGKVAGIKQEKADVKARDEQSETSRQRMNRDNKRLIKIEQRIKNERETDYDE